jgi:hypothetical protein
VHRRGAGTQGLPVRLRIAAGAALSGQPQRFKLGIAGDVEMLRHARSIQSTTTPLATSTAEQQLGEGLQRGGALAGAGGGAWSSGGGTFVEELRRRWRTATPWWRLHLCYLSFSAQNAGQPSQLLAGGGARRPLSATAERTLWFLRPVACLGGAGDALAGLAG